ncbi:hypothetical protein B296_00016419 [Ensete ventricosum]|uniref:Uncharacterized protein n=1 Tax=Ensete ventricosum TaxID=4639 RepID=A0A426Z0N0_ENSVE|nr:hypothetical protein B296_00016419 [Ensete ventricosum]
MISVLPLHEVMSLTSVQGKLRASAPCSLFYVDSLHAAWILHQVPPKLLRLSVYIELMVTLMSTILRVNPPLSPILISTLSLPSYDVVVIAPLLNLVMHPLMHYLIRDHATTRRSLDPLSLVEILS